MFPKRILLEIFIFLMNMLLEIYSEDIYIQQDFQGSKIQRDPF